MSTETPDTSDGPPSEQLDVALIGLGNLAHTHARHIEALGHRVSYGVDVDRDTRINFRKQYGAIVQDGITGLTRRFRPDCAIITTPNCFHEEYAVSLLEADIPVLCEKPLAHTTESARRIVETTEDSEAPLMVGFNNRFKPTTEVVYDAISEGRLGEITHIDVNFVRRRGIPGRGSWFTNQEMAGGGALIDIGVHIIDLALSFVEFPEVVDVSGQTRAQFGTRTDYTDALQYGTDGGPEGFTVEDSATGLLTCADGTTIDVDVAWASNRPSDETVQIEGTEAGIEYSLQGSEVTIHEMNRQKGRPETTTIGTDPESPPSHRRELEAFFECIQNGTVPSRNTPQQALAVQEVIGRWYAGGTTEPTESVQEDIQTVTGD